MKQILKIVLAMMFACALSMRGVFGEESSTNAVRIIWAGADVWASSSVLTNVAAWEIRLCDASKVSVAKMRSTFIKGDMEEIQACLTNALIVSTTGIVSKVEGTTVVGDQTVSWVYDGACTNVAREAGASRAYTLILNHAIDGTSGSYLMTGVEQGEIDGDGAMTFDFGILSDKTWGAYTIGSGGAEEEVVGTNVVALTWGGAGVPLGRSAVTNAAKWEVELLDASVASPGAVLMAIWNGSYSELAGLIKAGRVASTTGMVECVAGVTNGSWRYEGIWTNTIDVASVTNAQFYTMVFNRKIAAGRSGYYAYTGYLVPEVVSSNEWRLTFGSQTNMSWSAYELSDSSAGEPDEEVEPIRDPEAGSVQLFWTGTQLPTNGSEAADVTAWDIKLMDASKVSIKAMKEALSQTSYDKIAAVITNGLVASTTGRVYQVSGATGWNYEGYLPKAYTAWEYSEGESLSFYTVIFNRRFTNKSGKYAITSIKKTNIASAFSLCMAPFGSVSNLAWTAYTITKSSSGGDDSGQGDAGGDDSGTDDGDDEGESDGTLMALEWTGSGVEVASSGASAGEWKVYLMDAEKAAAEEVEAAFTASNFVKVSELLVRGFVTEATASESSGGSTNTRARASWSVNGEDLPEEYGAEGAWGEGGEVPRFYTMILNHGLVDNEAGRYMVTKEVESEVVKRQETGEDVAYVCKVGFSLQALSWRAYGFEATDGSADEDELDEVAFEWGGTKVAETAGGTEMGEWEFILMDAAKVSVARMRAAFETARYSRIHSLIEAGRVDYKVGAGSADGNDVSWRVSTSLPEEYATRENRAADSFVFYTLILNHALEEGEEGRYFISREAAGNIAAAHEFEYDAGEAKVSFSCTMDFGSQALRSWRAYDALCFDEEAGEEDGEEGDGTELYFVRAQTYSGYLLGADDVVAGTIQVKVGKQKTNKKTGLVTSVVTATIQIVGEKKVVIKGELDLDEGELEVAAKDGSELALAFTMDAAEGTFGEYEVVAMRDVFTSQDGVDQVVAKKARQIWGTPVGVAWMDEDGAGYNTLSLSLTTKGKVTVVGVIDGQKVSTRAQLVVDGEGNTCLPIVYTKKGAALCCVVKRTEEACDVVGLGDDVECGEVGSFDGAAEFSMVDGATFLNAVGDDEAVYSEYLPDGIEVTAKGTKWVLPKAGQVVTKDGEVDEDKLRENPSGLKLTYKAKTGIFTGSFKAYVEKRGKAKAVTASVTGVMIEGKGFGSAAVKKAVGAVTIE